MMMLILLDIDGVMVPAKNWKIPELLDDGFPAFSKNAVNALNALISKNDTIVLTTSHKSNYSIDQWKIIFENRGVNVQSLQSLPNNIHYKNRKDEILDWLESNCIKEEFLIIDDDSSLQNLPASIKLNLIATSSHIGLTEDHINFVNRIIRKKSTII